MKALKKLFPIAVAGGAVTTLGLGAAWMKATPSTRRFVMNIVKQVPALPYRYFI